MGYNVRRIIGLGWAVAGSIVIVVASVDILPKVAMMLGVVMYIPALFLLKKPRKEGEK